MKKFLFVTLMLIIACGMTSEQKAIDILQQGLHDDSILKIHAAKGLAQIGDVNGITILYDMTRADDTQTCAAALSALSEISTIEYTPALAQLAEHKEPLVRAGAYQLIAQIDDEDCRRVLVHGTHDEVAKIRRLCYRGLEKFGEQDVILHGLRDIDPLTRISAAQACGMLGMEGMANFIKNELVTESTDIIQHGLLALAEIGDTAAISLMRESAFSASWDARLAAVEALIIMGKQDDVQDVLETAAESQDPFVRARIARILKEHQLPDKAHLLEKLAHDEYVNVSVVALDALSSYRMKKYQGLFAKLMDTPNATVRIAAAAAYLQVK